MISGTPTSHVFPSLIAVAVVILSGCSVPASGPVEITKVNPYHLDDHRIVRTDDEMLEFRQRRLLYGAVDVREQRKRYGNYFTIFWKTESKSPATVRLDYRQGSTGPEIHTREVRVEDPGRKNTTKFQITGNDYHENGAVTQWKASIIEDGAVVAEQKSFLWKQ